MKLSQILVGASAGLMMAAAIPQAMAESPLTANVGVTSNYLWRGVSQTDDTSAISGGIDYAHASGAYIGTWVSNESWTATDGYEQDLYAGYGFTAGPVDLDVGYIAYMYPVGTGTDDFDEVYVNATFKNFGAGIAYTVSKEASTSYENDTYIYVSAEFEVKKDLTLGLLYGDYDYEDPAAGLDYSHVQVSLSKDDFTFAYDDTDLAGDSGDARFTVSWSKSFDL